MRATSPRLHTSHSHSLLAFYKFPTMRTRKFPSNLDLVHRIECGSGVRIRSGGEGLDLLPITSRCDVNDLRGFMSWIQSCGATTRSSAKEKEDQHSIRIGRLQHPNPPVWREHISNMQYKDLPQSPHECCRLLRVEG